jgi:glycerophosphoryl diester phosphodiesterase
MCELDVRRTADDVLVVIHDDTLARTTDGHGKIAATSFAELQRLDASRWRGPTFEHAHVPTLQEVLELVGGKCALNIELKATGIAAAVCALVARQHAEESTLISSFDWSAIATVRRIAPTIATALLTDRAALRAVATAAQMGAAAVNPRHELVDHKLCGAAHQRNLKLYAWTVDDSREMQRLIDAGVDGIMTNYPARLRALTQG